MTIRKTATTLAALVAVAAGSLAPLTTAANAHERNGYARDFGGPRFNDGPRFNKFDDRRSFGRRDFDRRDFGHSERGYRRGHDGRAIALGIGALMLGAIIASEASRH